MIPAILTGNSRLRGRLSDSLNKKKRLQVKFLLKELLERHLRFASVVGHRPVELLLGICSLRKTALKLHRERFT